jgi:spore coat polysaccharide biosynthesis protein SpsF (cytidylyltransferase family)
MPSIAAWQTLVNTSPSIFARLTKTKSGDVLILKTCTTENRKFTDELFLEIAQKYLDKDITYFFQKHIINGLDIELKSADLIDEFKIEYIEKTPKIVVEKEMKEKYILK